VPRTVNGTGHGDEERGAVVARRPEADPAFGDGLVRKVDFDEVVGVDVVRQAVGHGPSRGVGPREGAPRAR